MTQLLTKSKTGVFRDFYAGIDRPTPSAANLCRGDTCDGCHQPKPTLYRYEVPGPLLPEVKRLCIPCLAIATRHGWEGVQQARTRHRAPQEPRRHGKGAEPPQYGVRGPRYRREKYP